MAVPLQYPNTTKTVRGVSVAARPGVATVTGIRETDTFVYLNLNGGDSWGYYYPKNNPEILFNFKGEPNYLVKELLPDHYASLKQKQNPVKQTATATRYWAFLDKRSGSYYRGTYDAKTNRHHIRPIDNIRKITDFYKQHGQPVPDFIPEWDAEFRFEDKTIIDFKKQFVNYYQPSEFIQNPKASKTVPPTIQKIIWSALGSDSESYEHFLNWLAVIFQHRTMTGVAWILHGTQGTGKGLLFNEILTPLVGMDYIAKTSLDTFDKPFNGFAEQSIFILVDEVQISEMVRRSNIMANLKALITEPIISIRRMHTNQYNARNYANFLFASNKNDPIQVDPDDRRFNVAVRQEEKLDITQAEIYRVKTELPQFIGYLLNRKADIALARTPLINDERTYLQQLTRDSSESVADAIRAGDLQFLFDNRPDDEDPGTLALLTNSSSLPTFKTAIRECLSKINRLFSHNKGLYTRRRMK